MDLVVSLFIQAAIQIINWAGNAHTFKLASDNLKLQRTSCSLQAAYKRKLSAGLNIDTQLAYKLVCINFQIHCQQVVIYKCFQI